jgi:hypothetical protein
LRDSMSANGASRLQTGHQNLPVSRFDSRSSHPKKFIGGSPMLDSTFCVRVDGVSSKISTACETAKREGINKQNPRELPHEGFDKAGDDLLKEPRNNNLVKLILRFVGVCGR